MTHVPGNAYTRSNPAFKNAGAPFAFEVVEDDADGRLRVLARVEFTHTDEGEPVVWLTGGALTADQALRLAETIQSMVEQPPIGWDPRILGGAAASAPDRVEVWSDFEDQWEACTIVGVEERGRIAKSIRWGWEVTLADRPDDTEGGTRARWREAR